MTQIPLILALLMSLAAAGTAAAQQSQTPGKLATLFSPKPGGQG